MERLKPLRARASSQICYEVFRSNRPPPRPDCRRAAYRTPGRVAPLERRTRPARAPVRPLPGYLLGGADGPDGAFFSVGWLGVPPAPPEPLALPLDG